MSAQTAGRRKVTAAEGARQLGVSPRTIQRLVAEPRHEFEGRARERRATAVRLRERGMKYQEIADEMGVSTGTVGRLLHDARKHAATTR